LAAYAVVGLLAGWLGSRLSEVITGGATRGMTWVFVFFFAAVAIGFDKHLRLPRGGAILSRIFRGAGNLSPVARAGALGALTPLLPCAPLYLVTAAAALSGSAWSGGLLMAAFGVGTVPLLYVMQNRLSAMQRRWSPRTLDYVRRGLALASVAILLVRGTYTASVGCPMCH
jgi:sulfite exporter TauE/SafE